MVNLIQATISLFQAIFDGVGWKGFIMLDPGEPFFLSSGNNLIVTNNGCCTVVIKSRYSKNFNP
jgi:hypothetical protein